jgi:hypothetical protein
MQSIGNTQKSIETVNQFASPLTFTTFGDQSEIDAKIDATGQWETIATVHSVAGIDAEEIAQFIVEAVTMRQELLGRSRVMNVGQ